MPDAECQWRRRSGSINTRWQDVVLVAARALQVPAAGVDLEAGQCGCRRVSVDISSFERLRRPS